MAFSLLGNNPGHVISEYKSTVSTYLSYFSIFPDAFYLFFSLMHFKWLYWIPSGWLALKALGVSLPQGDLASLLSHVGKLQTRQQRCPRDSGRVDDGAV